MKLSSLLLKDIDKMTILTEGRGMQPTGNSSYGITGIWELVTKLGANPRRIGDRLTH
jgi:hypothetical protein